jgi:hypothetical protein
VHRGDEVLGDAVEQLGKAAEDALLRELTVSFVGEDGEDAGGLLKEFCQARVAHTCPVRVVTCAASASAHS